MVWVFLVNLFILILHYQQKTHSWAVLMLWLIVANLLLMIFYRHSIRQEWDQLRTNRRVWVHETWKNWGEPFLVAAVLAILIRTFLLGPYKIPTGSMIPTFMVEDRIFVDKVSYHFREPERGDIIVFKYPEDKKKDFVKRLIGLPNETLEIRSGKIYVNDEPLDEPPFSEQYYYNVEGTLYGGLGQKIKVPDGYYFVLGDNSAHSSDSRNWGFVPKENLVGRAFLIWWPPNRIMHVK